MATVKGQVPVRGTCKAGHVTEGTSAKGRVTAEFECAHDGCNLRVKARRKPGQQPGEAHPEPAAPRPAAAGSGSGDPYHVTEVIYDRDDSAGPNAGGPRAGDDDPAGGSDEGESAQVEEGPPVHHSVEQPRGGTGRWNQRPRRLSRDEQRAARARADEEWIVPNILPR